MRFEISKRALQGHVLLGGGPAAVLTTHVRSVQRSRHLGQTLRSLLFYGGPSLSVVLASKQPGKPTGPSLPVPTVVVLLPEADF